MEPPAGFRAIPMAMSRVLLLGLVVLAMTASMPVATLPGPSWPAGWAGTAAAEDCVTVNPQTGDVSVEPDNCYE